MADVPPSETLVLDLRAEGPTQVNNRLRTLESTEVPLHIQGVQGQPGLCCGIALPLKIALSGTVGAYFGMLNCGADLDLQGDAGNGCGHSMESGSILVRGHAGAALGALAHGGFIGVHGSAKECCGLGLNGADIIVRQTVGPRAGQAMRSGNLILGNDAGAELGRDATGGTIYLRGTAASVAEHMREVKMRDSDAMRLGLLLVRAGIKAATKDFRIYRPRVKSEA